MVAAEVLEGDTEDGDEKVTITCGCQHEPDREAYLCRFCGRCHGCDHVLIAMRPPTRRCHNGDVVVSRSSGQERIKRA